MDLWMVHLWLVRMYRELQHWGCRTLVKQRRHFKASEFIELLKASVKPLDSWYGTWKGENILSQPHLIR